MPAACIFWVPRGTSRGASTISCAAAPDARAMAGTSRFFLSLEDDLMRIFGSERMRALSAGAWSTASPSSTEMVTKAIERAQSQVEGRNFEVRKHLLEYDDVMNKQREAIYELRKDILSGKEGRDYVLGLAEDIIGYFVDIHCPAKSDPGIGT